ncbi:MAG: type VI secretion system baseplate subunit TssF [Polyangiaceae bacterium]
MIPSSQNDQSVFDEFLQELQGLNDFRAEYAHRYDFEGLGREDPDVERLVEAMAFYRARTRSTVEHGLREYQLRALEQLFPYLLSPMPAMGILYPRLASNFTDTRSLPARAEISVASPEADVEESPRVFRTTRELTVFPLHIVERSVRLSRNRPATPGGDGGASKDSTTPWTLRLDVAPSPDGRDTKRYYDDPAKGLRELRFYLDPKGDTLTALRLYDALQRSCRGVLVRVLAEGSERYRTGPVRVRFGSALSDDGGGSFDNPIEWTRRCIHFALAQLYVEVPLMGLPSEWNRLSLEFQLDDGWPEGLQAADSSFVLGGVPVENLVTRTAEPLSVDGTKLRNEVVSAEEPLSWKVREIRGIYTTDPSAPGARKTVLPRSLFEEGYTAIARGSGAEREVWLEIDSTLGDVEAPATLYVDAEWYDPDPKLPAPRSAIVRADAHDLGPLSWQLLEPLRMPSDSPLLAEPQLLERLLELQGKAPSCARELKSLLQILGVAQSEPFTRIPRYIEALESALLPDLQSQRGTIRSYDVRLSCVPAVLLPAARLLFSFLPRFLATWTGEPDVRISVFTAVTASTQPWAFEWRTSSHA